MTNPEGQLSKLEQNKRQAALAVAQQYQSSHRRLEVLKHDAQKAKEEGNRRYRGWLVETYFLAIELWEEALAAPKIGALQDLVIDRRPRPKPVEPKPTIPRPDKPIRALPISKAAQARPIKPQAEIFSERKKAKIARQLSGEIDLDGKGPEEFPIELFFSDTSEITVTDRTPGVFGQYYHHPSDKSPRIFTEDKTPRTSRKHKQVK